MRLTQNPTSVIPLSTPRELCRKRRSRWLLRDLRRVALALSALLLVGCSSVRVEYEHTSHLLAGAPFAADEGEDSLDTINVVGRHQEGIAYVELGLGHKFYEGGFDGPSPTVTMRFGVELWRKK